MIELVKQHWPYVLGGFLFGVGILWFINWIVDRFFDRIDSIEMRITKNEDKD